MKDLKDIQTVYETSIKGFWRLKSQNEAEFHNKIVDIKKQINDTSLKYLKVSGQINDFVAWIVQMVLNANNIIKAYQDYVQAIWENLDLNDETLKSYEDKIQEQEELNSELREKMVRLKEENEVLLNKIKLLEEAKGKDVKKQVKKQTEPKMKYGELAAEFVAKRKKQPKLPLYFFLKTKLKHIDHSTYNKHKYHMDKQIKLLEEKKDDN